MRNLLARDPSRGHRPKVLLLGISYPSVEEQMSGLWSHSFWTIFILLTFPLWVLDGCIRGDPKSSWPLESENRAQLLGKVSRNVITLLGLVGMCFGFSWHMGVC